MEEVKFSDEELHSDQDEASILSYMQKIYPGHLCSIFLFSPIFCCNCVCQLYFVTKTPHSHFLDEWTNFLERLGTKVKSEDIRYWASFRGQTLSRTGNMEYNSHFFVKYH